MAGAPKTRGAFARQAQSMREAVGDELEEARRHVRRLQVQRREVAALPVTMAVARARIERFVGGLELRAAEFTPDLEDFLAAPEHFRAAGCREPADSYVRYLAPLLLETMSEKLSTLAPEGDGVSDAERAERLAKVDRDLLDAELLEEAIIRGAEMAGFQVARRPDADPAAVLAAEEALP